MKKLKRKTENLDINVSLVLSTLEEWSRVAYDNEYDFLEMFCKGDAWTLIEITWGSESCKFVYIINIGAHIVNSIKMEEWLKWYNQKTKK